MHSNKKQTLKVQAEQIYHGSNSNITSNMNNNQNNNHTNQATNINRALYLMRAVEGTPKDRFLLTR